MVFESVDTALAYVAKMMKGQAADEASEGKKPAGKKKAAAPPEPDEAA